MQPAGFTADRQAAKAISNALDALDAGADNELAQEQADKIHQAMKLLRVVYEQLSGQQWKSPREREQAGIHA